MPDACALASTRPLASKVDITSVPATGRAAASMKSSASRTAIKGFGLYSLITLQAGVGGDIGFHLRDVGRHHDEFLRQVLDVFETGRTLRILAQGIEYGLVELGRGCAASGRFRKHRGPAAEIRN